MDNSVSPLPTEVLVEGDDTLEEEGTANGEVTGFAAGVEGLGVVGTLVTGDGVRRVGFAVGVAGNSNGADGTAPEASGINDDDDEVEVEVEAEVEVEVEVEEVEETEGRVGMVDEAEVVVVVLERGNIKDVTEDHVFDILELKPLFTVAATTKLPKRSTDMTTPAEAHNPPLEFETAICDDTVFPSSREPVSFGDAAVLPYTLFPRLAESMLIHFLRR